MEMMGKIRRMYFRDKLSLHEITKRTGLARNTIRKSVREPEAKQPVYQRRAVFNKLRSLHAMLEQALKADTLRPKQQRRSAKALWRKSKPWGMKVAMASSPRLSVPGAVGTAANAADITRGDKLLHGDENMVGADAGYKALFSRAIPNI